MHHRCVHLLYICMKNITLLKFWDKEVLNSEAYTLSKDALIENGTSTQHYARHVFGTSGTSLQRG